MDSAVRPGRLAALRPCVAGKPKKEASALCVGSSFEAHRSARARAVREPYGPHGSRTSHERAENGRDSAKPQLGRKHFKPLPHSCDKDDWSCRTSARKAAGIPQNPSWEHNLSNSPRTRATRCPPVRRTSAGPHPPPAPLAGDDAEKVMDPCPRAAEEAPPCEHRFRGRSGVPSVPLHPVPRAGSKASVATRTHAKCRRAPKKKRRDSISMFRPARAGHTVHRPKKDATRFKFHVSPGSRRAYYPRTCRILLEE